MEWLFGKSFNPQTDVGDLSGKTILVTGGTEQIGFSYYRSRCQDYGQHLDELLRPNWLFLCQGSAFNRWIYG